MEGLLSTLRGKEIRPSDEGYDAARRVYNAMIDRHPRLIVQCADVKRKYDPGNLFRVNQNIRPAAM